MQREIKFRAWDRRFKGMNDCRVMDEKVFTDMLQGKMSDELIPLQFTGLKDKNGKEIYDGDIVSCEGGYDWPEGTMGCEHPGKVVFEEGSWRVECIDGCQTDLLYEFDINEIIGNIYENPDLLKA